jgi:ribonuclease HI
VEQFANIILDITGCTAEQANAAVSALISKGWSPPATTAAPTATGLPAQVSTLSLENVPAGSFLTAHTDGACSGNPGPGGWSVVFGLDGAVVAEFSGSGGSDTTNNRMELTAVREAIQHAPVQARLEIVTDSKNVIGWLDQGFKRNDPASPPCAARSTGYVRRGRARTAAQSASDTSAGTRATR